MLASSSKALIFNERSPFFKMTGTVRRPIKLGLMLFCVTIVVCSFPSVGLMYESVGGHFISCSPCFDAVFSIRFTLVLSRK